MNHYLFSEFSNLLLIFKFISESEFCEGNNFLVNQNQKSMQKNDFIINYVGYLW